TCPTLCGSGPYAPVLPKLPRPLGGGFFLRFPGGGMKVVGAEVMVQRSVLEHVVDGGKDGGGDRHDRLLGASLCFDVVELGVEIAVFFAHRCPGALHQCSLEPG